MKTNRAARSIRKVRFLALCVAIAGMAGLGFTLGKASAVRAGQTSALQCQGQQAPNMSLGNLMPAAR